MTLSCPKSLQSFQFQHTAARRRLGPVCSLNQLAERSFNTQPPEGGWECLNFYNINIIVSTHSRPKAAGISSEYQKRRIRVSTHSRPKAAGFDARDLVAFIIGFQHTAARRRLASNISDFCSIGQCFNTQPPEGGWHQQRSQFQTIRLFQHTAARRRLVAP